MAKGVKGWFITFEGPECSGKSTHAKLLQKYLADNGFASIFVREPGSTKFGEHIRELLLNKKNNHLTPQTEMLLYMAARSQLVNEVIKPALAKSKVVICDRYLDSTIAYQGYGLGIDKDLIISVGKFVTEGIMPRLTFLLEMNDRENLFKKKSKKDRIELRSDKYHERVTNGYRALARHNPKRIKIIYIKHDIASTQQQIRDYIDQCLLKK